MNKDQVRPRLPLKRRLQMFAAMLLISLGCGELVLRSVLPDIELRRRLRDGGLYVPFAPSSSGDLWRPEFRVRYDINRFGYRDAPRDPARRVEGKKRIAVLGDSFSVGWGVEQDACYPALLESKLPAELWNTARSGNNPLFYVAQARAVIERFQPDALLVQVFDNDLQENGYFQGRFDFDDAGLLTDVPSALKPNDGLFRRFKRSLNGLALRRAVKTVKRRLRGEDTPRHFLRPGRATSLGKRPVEAADMTDKLAGRDSAFDSYFSWIHESERAAWAERFALEERLLTQLIEESRAAGCPVALLYIPHVLFVSDSDAARAHRAGNPHRALLAKVASATGIRLFDASELLAATPEPTALYFPGDLHLNAAGHSALATALAAPLSAFLNSLPN